MFGIDEELVRQRRIEEGLVPAFKRIDTCAAEFESFTPYMYGTYEQVDESEPTPKKKVVILGSGPTASARASSSTTAAVTPSSASARKGSRR